MGRDGSATLTDSFTYTIDDLAGDTSNIVTVSLTVTPVNDPPIITSNRGGANATVTVTEGSTAVTDVNASDTEGDPLTFSIIGGADAALFSIVPTTGVLTFDTAPDSQAPGDVGGDNVYDVIVQVSDGTASDIQTIAVTVPNVPPVVVPLPQADPTPDQIPLPSEGDADTVESEDETSEGGVPVVASSPGDLPDGNQDSTTNDSKDSDSLKNPSKNGLAAFQLATEKKSIGHTMSDLLDILRKPLDISTFKSEIKSLLRTSSGFLKDLDHTRDALNNVMATEQTYVASSVAVSSGLSIGYVIWLLRSGVLLTALLSSVPAWQFVNPLLVLGSPVKKTRQKGQEDLEDDSLESMFEQQPRSTETSEKPTPGTRKTRQSRWFRRTET
jgi:hypothetical protein